MAATKQDLEYFAGDTLQLSLTINSSGVAVNISAWIVELTIKANPDLDDELPTIQVRADLTDGASGIAVFTLAPYITLDLLGHYRYDVKYLKPTGVVGAVLYGKMVFKRSINVSIGDTPSASPSLSPSSSPS